MNPIPFSILALSVSALACATVVVRAALISRRPESPSRTLHGFRLLLGVNTLTQILVASILGKYPQLKVEVAGHTDSIGTEQYNQGLSERRAKAVYDYLTAHGIDAGRLVGPHGFGESHPIAPNTNADGSDNPEGRARNRRTELNVEN